MPNPMRTGSFQKALKAGKHNVLMLFPLIVAGCQTSTPDDLLLDAQPDALIFVRTMEAESLDNNFIRGGSDLYSLTPISPNGQLKNLTDQWTGANGAVADPEVSYDGLKIIFSMRKSGANNFDIYEMNVDGSNLRQITTTPYDEADPVHLPNGKIAYTCNERNIRDEYERREVENLHTMNADGGNVQGISFNNSDDFDPVVMRDGRIVWTRWEHHGTQNRFPLFFTRPDGQGTFLFFGTHEGGFHRNFFHPRELPDGKVIAVLSDGVLDDHGPLVILNSDRTTGDPPRSDDYVNITPNVPVGNNAPQAFKYPFPLPDGRIVASYSTNGVGGNYGLYTMNRDGSRLSLLYDDPQAQELDAVVATPRAKPPVIAEATRRDSTTGVFINQDVYFRQSRDGQARPRKEIQEVKSVMVIEGLPIRPNDPNMREIGHTDFEPKRILGVAPVYADGSFAIRVPVNTPISFNTLDSLGRAIVIKRSWLYARPGEAFENCTGCHGPRGQKSNDTPFAATQVPTNLNVPVAQREVVSFKVAIEPIIAQKCLPCHGGAEPAEGLNLSIIQAGNYSVAYENLMTAGGNPPMVENNSPPFSRRSRLADVLLGTGSRSINGKHPAPGTAQALTQNEIRRFINWIDLGAQYY
ncbi:MAG: hypothetical protein ACREOO_06360 [bacterium]